MTLIFADADAIDAIAFHYDCRRHAADYAAAILRCLSMLRR
jgi:hypothetical protein